MKLLQSIKNKTTKDEHGKNVPYLEITAVVFVHCSIAKNDYQHDFRVLYTFFPNKPLGQLLDVLPKNFVFKKTFNSKF